MTGARRGLLSSPQAAGAGLIIFAAAGFGTLGPLARYADDAGVTSLALVTWRAGVGAALMVGFLLLRRAAGHRPAKRWSDLPVRDRRFVIGGALTNAVLNLAVFIAFVRIGIALSLLIFYIYPAFVALVSALWFGERLDRLRWAALGISLAGAVLVVAGGGALGSLDLLGIGLAFVGALAQTFYALAARHAFSAVPGPQAAAVTMGGAAGIYVAVAVVTGQLGAVAFPLGDSAALWPVLLAGLLGAALPTVSFIVGIRLLGAPRATILSTLEPVVGVSLAALLFNELPTAVQIAGGVLIVAAGVLLQLRPRGAVAEHEAVVGSDVPGDA
ncbi:MAG: DMT family transporter [Chloroflexota bacterium]|nr:DMT family transporter [Chloroflexota bacterium]